MVPQVQTSPKAQAPKPEDFNAVIDAQANTMEASLEELAPVADYSAGRLSALAKSLDKVVSLFGSLPPTVVPPAIKGGKLPIDMLLRIAAARAAAQGWHEMDETVDVKVMDIPELINDGAIAMLCVQLDKLAADKDFKKFLKSPAKPMAPEAPESSAEEMEEPIPDLGEQGNKDAETMFGK